MRFLQNRFVATVGRLLALCALIGLSGLLVGAAVGWPLGRIDLQTSQAVRLDQARLVGSIDPEVVVAVDADLPVGWTPGDPGIAMFGILNNEFCGEAVDMPAAITNVKGTVFVNQGGDGTLIIQAVRLERWQNAREYVRDVERTVSDCDKFFNNDAEGNRRRTDIKEGQGDPPITDFVSRSYVREDGGDIQYWSIMAVGDVVIGIRYVGKSAPQHSLLPDLQNHILMRIAPQDFAPGDGDTRLPDDTIDDGVVDEPDNLGSDDVEEPRLEDGTGSEPLEGEQPPAGQTGDTLPGGDVDGTGLGD